MNIKQIALSIEQMKHLESLGLDTSDASMCYHKHGDNGYSIEVITPDSSIEALMELYKKALTLDLSLEENSVYLDMINSYTPAYTLQDILEKLPESIPYWKENSEYRLFIRRMNDNKYYFEYSVYECSDYEEYGYVNTATIHTTNGDILEASYQILLWCIKNNYIKTNKT